MSTHNEHASDLVPIADRMRYLQTVRVASALAVLVYSVAAPDSGLGFAAVLALSAVYLALGFASQAAWRASRRGGVALFGVAVMVDGVYLIGLSYASGLFESPLSALILVHLIAVSLLASYRTGMKLALWDSLLLVVAQEAEKAGVLSVANGAMDIPFAEVAMLSGVLLVVAGATASFSAVNERELRRRRYDLEALAGMARSLEESEGSSSAGVVLVSSVADAFDFERSVLVGSRDGDGDGDGDGLAALAFHGDVSVNEPPVAVGEGSVIARARSERRVQLVTHIDPAEDPWLDALLPGARQVAVFPLTVETHSLGVLCVEHSLRRGSRIERRVVSTIERFVSHGALALQNAWLLEHIRSLAQTDGLTGVGNRDTFDTGLRGEISRAARHGESFSLLMIDVDHFKMLNDDHGHLVGDTVLRRVARQIHHASRDSDTVARYGGEEFGVVLPGADTEEALIAADRIRRLIADAEPLPAVTVSIGVATFPLDGTEPDAIVVAADAALYRSKRTGRNRVTAAAPPANALFV